MTTLWCMLMVQNESFIRVGDIRLTGKDSIMPTPKWMYIWMRNEMVQKPFYKDFNPRCAAGIDGSESELLGLPHLLLSFSIIMRFTIACSSPMRAALANARSAAWRWWRRYSMTPHRFSARGSSLYGFSLSSIIRESGAGLNTSSSMISLSTMVVLSGMLR